MNNKKSAFLLSIAAIPAAVTFVSNDVSANNTYDWTQIQEVIKLIDKIDPTSTTYNYYLTEAYNAYYRLSEYERQYVSNSSRLFNYYNNTDSNGNYIQNSLDVFIKKMNSISISKSSFLRDVKEANRYYDALSAAQKAGLSQYYVKQLTTYNTNIAKMTEVENSFNALDVMDANYVDNYLAALRDYNRLDYSYRKLIETVVNKKIEQYNQYHSADYNRSIAQQVITAISKLTTSSNGADVVKVRALYNGLTTIQKSYISNYRDLQYIEDVQKNIENGWNPDYENEDEEDIPKDEISVIESGTTYTVYLPVAKMKKHSSTTIKVSDTITLSIPKSAIPESNKSAVVVITIDDYEDYGLNFNATMYDKELEFSTYIDIIVKGLSASDTILKVAENGDTVAAPFKRASQQHTIKTKTSNEYVVENVEPHFYDIAKEPLQYEIMQLAKRKIVSGLEENYYKPKANVTIAQYAVMISRAMDLTTSDHATYSDIRGKWFEDAIESLIAANILDSNSGSNFYPNQIVTRKQAAQMSIRMLEHAGVAITEPNYSAVAFKDFKQMTGTERYYAAVANELGIFGGKADGRFDPNGQLTRSQMAKVLYRTLQIAKMM
ncbi:S-layer homology domain-containing protein [Solibacillus sp. MA9]|uniref:S-layer homology domain-containing protein n=1 Tax=Solibacillus palustris TaxID=2908203 RepID=A0ABS9UE23_9BACL|nr:S-layer homology domain-containing protein [Solibacillus sp. MA9]MCH7322559.1 S-layer homology domain-containing protein [Solibacillus sp. MA9]